MEFNLKKVLKTLLISTADPVSIKDIQTVITRYHEQREKEAAATKILSETADEGDCDAHAESDGTTAPAPLGGVAAMIANGASSDANTTGDFDAELNQRVIQDIIDQVPTLLTATQIREAADALNQEMIDAGEVTRILQGAEGFRLTIAPEYAEWVRLLRNDPKPQRLSQAALETLAIIAYRQPVTRSEIESIRGVSADSAVNRLVDLELVIVTGRADLPGRPIQYGTTEKFLDFCGIKGLDELPASDVLSPGQISEWIARATNPVKLSDQDVGLAQDDGTEERAERTTLLSSEFDDPNATPTVTPVTATLNPDALENIGEEEEMRNTL